MADFLLGLVLLLGIPASGAARDWPGGHRATAEPAAVPWCQVNSESFPSYCRGIGALSRVKKFTFFLPQRTDFMNKLGISHCLTEPRSDGPLRTGGVAGTARGSQAWAAVS